MKNNQQPKWLFESKGAEVWNTSDEFETKEEAIVAGRAHFIEDPDRLVFGFSHFVIGRQRFIGYGVDGDAILESLNEQVYSEVGEVAEEWLVADATIEQVKELEGMLNEKLREWIDKHDLHPRFYAITDIEEVPLVPTDDPFRA